MHLNPRDVISCWRCERVHSAPRTCHPGENPDDDRLKARERLTVGPTNCRSDRTNAAFLKSSIDRAPHGCDRGVDAPNAVSDLAREDERFQQ